MVGEGQGKFGERSLKIRFLELWKVVETALEKSTVYGTFMYTGKECDTVIEKKKTSFDLWLAFMTKRFREVGTCKGDLL